jgi:hypothetical protein
LTQYYVKELPVVTSYTHANDALAHHAANAAAVVFPLSSIILHLPETLSITLMCAGLAWYGVLFYDRFKRKDTIEPPPEVPHEHKEGSHVQHTPSPD